MLCFHCVRKTFQPDPNSCRQKCSPGTHHRCRTITSTNTVITITRPIPSKRPIHHDWRFWVSLTAVILMLAAMFMYVTSDDESLQPGGKVGPTVPAAE